MRPEFDPEDETILAALDELAGGEGVPAAPGAGGDETLHRLYVELLGLLPSGLEPSAPPPGSLDRILRAAAGGTATVEDSRAQDVEPPTLRLLPPSEMAVSGPAATTAGERRSEAPWDSAFRGAASRRPARWPLALASTLAIALAGLSAWLYSAFDQQQEQITALTEALGESQRQITALRETRTELSALRDRFHLVTKPNVLISRLAPSGPQPIQPGARGILFIARDNRSWFLCLEGLAAADRGRAYQLWFLSESGPVSAGTFSVQPGEDMVEMASRGMPAGTQGILVTVEPLAGSALPTGPQVLSAGI